MGTRSRTVVYDENFPANPIVCIYRQFDGYPSGHGKELVEFMTGREIINGIPSNKKMKNASNGMGCFAAGLIGHLKKDIGNIYIIPITDPVHEDYEYRIFKDKVSVHNYSGENIFYGSWEDFAKFCSDDEVA